MIKHQQSISPKTFFSLVQTNLDFIVSQLQSLNREIHADLLFIAGVNESLTVASTAVVISDDKVVDNFSYSLAGSPCETLLDNSVCVLTEQVCQRFPKDIVLQKMEIEGYIGVPIYSDTGKVLGILVGLCKTPRPDLTELQYAFTMSASYLTQFLEKTWYSQRLKAQLSLLNEVEALSKLGAWEYQVQTDKLFWSDHTYKLHGMALNSAIALKTSFALYSRNSQKQLETLLEAAIKNGKAFDIQLELYSGSGKKSWLRVRGEPDFDCKKRVFRVYGEFEDITRERLLLNDLRYKNARLKSILDNLNDAVVTINSDGVIAHVNAVAESMFGYAPGELSGLPVEVLMPEPYASHHKHYMAQYQKTGEAKIIGAGRQLPGKRKCGEIFQMELALTCSDAGDELEYIGIIRDISERIQAQDAIYNLAYTDPISGLKNKTWFEKECKDLLIRARLENRYIYAAVIDIDKMSQFNLKYGFKTGNTAISLVAKNLQSLLNHDTRLYKNGGDSFILLSLKTFDQYEAREFECQWQNSGYLSNDVYQISIHSQSMKLSASIGSCICDAQSHTFESVMDTLEHTARKAKLKQPFGSYFIDEAGIQVYERIKKMRTALEHLTESDELRLVFQPQYDAHQDIVSSEALIRWYSSELGFVSPLDFITLAEESNAIIAIGDWVLQRVCQLLGQLKREGITTRVSVNISSKQIVAPDFQNKLATLIAEYELQPEQIMLELTETALVSDVELVKNVMLDMKQQGFLFSIDDFGTGYSSLNYLKELPISELKIDKCFVDDITADQVDSGGQIVSLILDMAKILKVDCVAEGVETQIQKEFLMSRNCNIYQGYYFSKPLEEEDWLKAVG